MDKHLNLFYSYDGGSRKDLERKRQLENNLTRAFIITLKSLSKEKRMSFLKSLLPEAIGKEDFCFELQSVDDKMQMKKLQRCSKKFVVVIQSSDVKIGKVDIARAHEHGTISQIEVRLERLEPPAREKVSARLKNYANQTWSKLKESKNEEITEERKSFFDGLNEIFENNKVLSLDSHELNRSLDSKEKLLSFQELIFETYRRTIPDAWIYNDEAAILIEAKVGSNPIAPYQIQRHLTHKNGLKIELKEIQKGDKCNKYSEIVCLTWERLFDVFEGIMEKIDHSEKKDIFLIKQFKEYIAMNNEKLDLRFITNENEGYDREKARELFPPLLEKLDQKIAKDSRTSKIGLVRSNRPKSDFLWDFYGIKNNVKVQQDPHYSINFDRSGAGIALTTKTSKKIKKLLSSSYLRDFIQDVLEKNPSSALRSRFSINLSNYRLIDWKMGQMKGETFSTFAFSINFFELNDDMKEIEFLLDDMMKYSKFAKQIGISFMVTYPDVSKIKEKQSSEENKNQSDEASIRKLNRDLFEDYDRLLQCYVDFIDQSNPLFKELISKV